MFAVEWAVLGILVVSLSLLFVGGDGVVYGVQAKTGKIVWKTHAGTQLQSAPAISNGRVVVAGCDNLLYVLDLKTGAQRFTTDIESPTGATPAASQRKRSGR